MKKQLLAAFMLLLAGNTFAQTSTDTLVAVSYTHLTLPTT